MTAPSLTYAQKNALESLSRGFGSWRTRTNQTMNALEKKGMVLYAVAPDRGSLTFTVGKWHLTAAGRAWVAAQAPPAGMAAAP